MPKLMKGGKEYPLPPADNASNIAYKNGTVDSALDESTTAVSKYISNSEGTFYFEKYGRIVVMSFTKLTPTIASGEKYIATITEKNLLPITPVYADFKSPNSTTTCRLYISSTGDFRYYNYSTSTGNQNMVGELVYVSQA